HGLSDEELGNIYVRDVYRYMNQIPDLSDDHKAGVLGVIFGSPPSALDPVVLNALGQIVESAKKNNLAYASRIDGITGAEVRLKLVRLRVVSFALKTLAAAMYFFGQLTEEDKVEARRILEAGLKELS